MPVYFSTGAIAILFSLDTFNLNKKYFLYQNIVSRTKVIQDALESFVKSKDIERLQLLNEILSEDAKSKFKPEKHFSDVIKKRLQDLHSEQDSEEKKAVIKSLAKKFNVNLSEGSKDISTEKE